MQGDIEKKNHTLENLNNEISKLKEALASAHNTLAEKDMALQVSQKEKDSASDDLATQIKSLQKETEEKEKNLQASKTKLKKVVDRFKTLQEQSKEKKAVIMELEEKISEIEQKCGSLESNIAKEREKAKRATERYKNLQKKTKETNKDKKEKIETLQKEVENLREQMTGREFGDTELAEKLDSICKEKDALEQEILTMKGDHDRVLGEYEEKLNVSETKLKEVEATLAEQIELTNQRQSEIDSLNVSASENNDNIDVKTLIEEKKDLEIQMAKLKTEFEVKNSMLEQMSLDTQNKCDSLESNIAKEREKAKRATERYKNLQKKTKETNKDKKEKIETLQKEVENLREQMTGREFGDTELAEKLDSICKEKDALEQEILTMKGDHDRVLGEYEEKLNVSETKLKEVEATLAEQIELTNQRQSEMDGLKQSIVSNEKDFEQKLQAELATAEANQQVLQKTLNEKSNELHKLQQLMDNLHPNESFDIKNSKIDGNNMRKSNLKEDTKDAFHAMQEVLQEQLASLSGMLENPSTDYYEEDRLRSNGGQQVSKEDELKRSFHKSFTVISKLSTGALTSATRLEMVKELKIVFLRLREEIIKVARKIDVSPSDILQEEEAVRREQNVKIVALEAQVKDLQDALRRADSHEVLVLKEASLAQAQMRNEYEREIARLHNNANYAIKSSSEWTRMQDSTTGKPYYVNRNTGHTQWEIPAELLTPTTEKGGLIDDNKKLNIEIESLKNTLHAERVAAATNNDRLAALEREMREMERKHVVAIRQTAADTRSIALDDLRKSNMKVDALNRQIQDLENRHTMEIEKLRTGHVLSLEELRSEAVREKDEAIRSLKSSINSSVRSSQAAIGLNASVSLTKEENSIASTSLVSSRSTRATPHLARERAKLLAAKIMRARRGKR